MRFRRSDSRGARGFSLVEIALALGVVALALVSILGLIPVALDAAEESRSQARAALISRRVFADLRAGVFTNAPVTTAISANGTEGVVFVDLSSNATNSVRVAYDADGLPLAPLNAGEFAAGFSGSGGRAALFLVELTSAPHGSIPGLARVDASVERPAAAATAARKRYEFTTLIGR